MRSGRKLDSERHSKTTVSIHHRYRVRPQHDGVALATAETYTAHAHRHSAVQSNGFI